MRSGGASRCSSTQQALRRHDDERLARAALHLTAQSVEVLRGRGEVADLPVTTGAALQEALKPGAGVLGTLALEAVRQQKRDMARALPLALGRGDELIEDDLRAIHEVTKLRFPAQQHVAGEQRVAVVKAEHGDF